MKIFIWIFLLITSFSFAQKGFEIREAKKTVIPFKLLNNLIFVPLEINGVEVTFLLDTGVNETILFSLDNKEINFNDTEKIKFSGLGESKDIEGLKSGNNIVKIGKNFKDENHTIFIILDESINFSSHIGIPVNGILGYQFFKNHPVKVDYISQKITVYNDEKSAVSARKRFEEFPISLEGNKPYMEAGVEMTNTKVNSKMLIDLGNSDAIWLFPKLIKDFVYNRPNIDDYLGQGFNGDIFGKRSRIHRFHIGDYAFEKPLTAMPDEYSIQSLKIVPDRKGSIGSDILRRFTVIFDYPANKIYFRKNTHFSDPFLFNKSGLDIQHDGMTWEKDILKVVTHVTDERSRTRETEDFVYNFVLKPKFSVAGCRKDSPCSDAGIKKGDEIIEINRRPVGNLTLEKIYEYLKKEDGTAIKFKIMHKNSVIEEKTLILKDPIPYQDEN